MMRLLAAMVVVAVLVLEPRPVDAVFLDGNGDTITGAGQRDFRSTGARLPPPGKLPPERPGKPRIVSRGKGDRPTPITFSNGPINYGPCVAGGTSFVVSDPLIQVPETVNVPACQTPAATIGGGGGGGAPVPPPPSPRDAALQAWYWETKLPDPTLATSPPDGAITGLDLYLTIGGQQSMTLDVPALGYVVHLEVTSVYDVYWGDPRPDDSTTGRAVTRNHPTQGGPYPNGDLRHQYIDRGSVTIEAAQKWTAKWSAGGESGTIADRLATSTSVTIPVQEIQAVIKG